MYLFRYLLLSFSLLFSNTIHYSVDLWGIHAADIITTYTDTIFQKKPAIKIEFTTTTTPLISQFFFVNNSYTTIINKENNTLLSFNKNTTQPKLNNTISTYKKNNDLFYSNNDQPVDIFNPNIFTLFYLLQFGNGINTVDRNLIIEREGLNYFANISSVKNNDETIYNLDLLIDNGKKRLPVYENTDIFTWAVFKPGAKRKITISKDKKIIKCEFSKGFIKIKAEAIVIQ